MQKMCKKCAIYNAKKTYYNWYNEINVNEVMLISYSKYYQCIALIGGAGKIYGVMVSIIDIFTLMVNTSY